MTTTETVERARPSRMRDPAMLAVILVMVVAFGVRLALLARPIARLDARFVPDDTYYTLTIARSIAHGRGPTADGSTLTSGFQPLLGFLITPVYWMTRNLDAALRADLLILVVLDTAIVALLAWTAFRLGGRIAAVAAAAIWALSPVAITLALGGLETSLAMLCEIGLVASCIRANDRSRTRRWVVAGVMAGLAVLARVDALLLVALLALIQLWRGPRRGVVAAAVAGAITLGPWWIWCAVNLGTPIPTSGSALHRLASYAPFSPHNLALTAGAVIGGPFGNPITVRKWLDTVPVRGAVVFVAVFVALLALSCAWLRPVLSARRATGGEALDPTTSASAEIAALPLFGAGLLLFYAWFGVFYFNTRYLAPVQLAVTMALAVLVSGLVRWLREPDRGRPVRLGCAALSGSLVLAIAAAVVFDVAMLRDEAPSPHLALDAATGFRAVAYRATRLTPKGSIVAAYQSGALSYYGDGRITAVNLDGVVDPNAPPPDNPANTIQYMRRRGVRYLIEWRGRAYHLVRADPGLSTIEIAHYIQVPFVQSVVLLVTYSGSTGGAPGQGDTLPSP